MFRDSSIFRHLNLVQMEKCINRLRRKVYQKDEVIIPGRVPLDKVFFIIDKFQWRNKQNDEAKYLKIINDVGFYNNVPLKFAEDAIAISSECKALEITYKELYEILGKEDLDAVFTTNRVLEEMYFRKRQIPKARDYSSMNYVRTLGEGGQGLVVLVEDESKRQSALKIIAKCTVKSKYTMNLVKVLTS